MLQIKGTWNKEDDSRNQVEQLLIDADIDFDELESPIQRANGSHKWLASFNGEPIAEIELTNPEESEVSKKKFIVVYDPVLNQGSVYNMETEADEFEKSIQWIDENSSYPGWVSVEEFETEEEAYNWLEGQL